MKEKQSIEEPQVTTYLQDELVGPEALAQVVTGS